MAKENSMPNEMAKKRRRRKKTRTKRNETKERNNESKTKIMLDEVEENKS